MSLINETDMSPEEVQSLLDSVPYDVAQGSDEWFEERLGKATASRFADIVKTTRYGLPTYKYEQYLMQLVVERLTGKRPRFTSAPMEWGKTQEEAAAYRYEEVTGNVTAEVGFLQHPELSAGASPDRLVGDDGQLEIKCPNTATHLKYLLADKLPDEYLYQVQGQLWITGNKWCDFVSHDPELPAGIDLFIKRVERDEEVIATIETRVRSFLEDLDTLVNRLQEKISE